MGAFKRKHMTLNAVDVKRETGTMRRKQNVLRQPGIEPRSQEWESCMIPLHHWHSVTPFLSQEKFFPWKILVL